MKGLISVVKADWNNGIVKCWRKIVAVVIIAAALTQNSLSSMYNYLEFKAINEKASFIECVIYMFRGMKEYIPADNKEFELPIAFMILNLFLAYMIGDYIVRDLHEFGMQLLLKSKRKYIWWISKCIWCVLTVVIFYLAVLFGILIVWIFYGTESGLFSLNDTILKIILGKGGESLELANGLLILLTIVCVSITISLSQMVLSLYIKPIASFITVMAIYVVSGYYMSGILLGNYMMIYRSSVITENGVDFKVGLLIVLIMAFTVSFFGYKNFKNKDIGL